MKQISPDTLLLLISNIHKVLSHDFKTSKLGFNSVMAACSQISSPGHSYGDNCSLLWLPIDLILEDAMDGGQAVASSAVEVITGILVNCIITMFPAWCWNG